MTEKVIGWMRKMQVQPSQETMQLYKQLIVEEFNEFISAYDDNNFVETVDGAGDLLWVTIGFLAACKQNPNEVMDVIAKSNNSKFTIHKDIASLSVEAYTKKGVESYYQEFEDQYGKYYLVKRTSDDKILKPITFTPPDWGNLIPPEFW